MANSILSAKVLQNEAAAIAWVEARVWPNGPVCPRCGGFDRIGKMGGKATRIGLWKCYQCRKQFTVKVGTVFEDSHVPMNLWLQAMYLLCSSKKGISSNQLSRTLGVTLKTAWFMSHRIREAMRVVGIEPMGSGGAVIEADETFIGRKKGVPMARTGMGHKMAVMTLVERGGKARSFHIDRTNKAEVEKIINANVSKEAQLMTDSASYYMHGQFNVADHSLVDHEDDEWARYEKDEDGNERVDAHQHGRELLLGVQARNERRLPALQ